MLPVHNHYRDPDTFLAQAPRKAGSWWPEWAAWLDARPGAYVASPAVGVSASALGDAPGLYVLED
jgi:polyhydroxyalkanoate synthase